MPPILFQLINAIALFLVGTVGVRKANYGYMFAFFLFTFLNMSISGYTLYQIYTNPIFKLFMAWTTFLIVILELLYVTTFLAAFKCLFDFPNGLVHVLDPKTKRISEETIVRVDVD